MAGKIIWFVTMFGCALVFYGIGVYARKLKKPMHFWSGGPRIDPAQLTDVPAYNRENSRMWKLYSLWYFAAALAGLWDMILAMILLIASFAAGFPILICTYNRIYKKYRIS